MHRTQEIVFPRARGNTTAKLFLEVLFLKIKDSEQPKFFFYEDGDTVPPVFVDAVDEMEEVCRVVETPSGKLLAFRNYILLRLNGEATKEQLLKFLELQDYEYVSGLGFDDKIFVTRAKNPLSTDVFDKLLKFQRSNMFEFVEVEYLEGIEKRASNDET